MNKHLFLLSFIVVATAMLATSCQKEEGTVTLGAEIQKPVSGNAKVYIDDHTPCWHNGDEVFINNTAYSIMAATGSTARIENVVSSSVYRAIFPASIVPTGSDISSSSSIPVTLPSTQQFELVGSHQLVDVPMGAYLTSGSTLQFYNLCSIVRVIVSNSLNSELQLSRIELQAQSAKLSGSGTATVSGQASDRINLSNSAQNHVSLTFTNNYPATVEVRSTSTFDIVVPAFTTDDVTIILYTTDGYMNELEKDDVALAHNTITTVTLNVTNLIETPPAKLVDGLTFGSNIPTDATSVVFEYNSSISSGVLLSTVDSPVPIYGNLDGTIWKVSTISSNINANPNCIGMFASSNIDSISFGDGFNTSTMTDMSYMFFNCRSLTSLNLTNFNTTNVIDMSHLFYSCDNLTSLDVSNFNTSNVRNMSHMFECCINLEHLDVSHFNTSNVTDMSHMFSGYWDLHANYLELDVSNFNTSNVTNMSDMFCNCSNLTSLDVSNFNTSNVTNMMGMFSKCSNITNLDVSNFNTENVTDMSSMFYYCSSLTSLNLSNFNTSNVTNMGFMFAGCSGLTGLNLSNFNTENVTDMYEMFSGCSSLTSINPSNFNTETVRYMTRMFSGCSSLTSLNLSNFNTENVIEMSSMFYGCSSLMSLNLSNFNTENITDMSRMFFGCSSLTSLNLSSFYTTNVDNMQEMFMNCSSLTSLNLAHFDMSHLTSHSYYTGGAYQTLSGKYDMCYGLSTTSLSCTIMCSLVVQTEIQAGTGLPTSGVTLTWLRP